MSLFSDLNSIYSIKQSIKSAIEEKGVDMTGVSFPDYPAAISQISTGTFVTETLSITTNGTFYPGTGVDGFSEVIVSVEGGANLSILGVSSNGSYTPETGYDGFNQVNVNIDTLTPAITGDYGTSTVLSDSNVTYIATGALGLYAVGSYSVGLESSYTILKSTLLTSIDFPNCSVVGSYGVWYQSQLRSISLPTCKAIFENGFAYCSSLTTVNLPACEYLGKYAFYNIPVSSLSLPNCTYISEFAFGYNSVLTSVSLPKCSYIGWGAFNNCNNLSSVYISGSALEFGGSAFAFCYSLQTVVLAGSYIASFRNIVNQSLIDIFKNSPLIQGLGNGFYVNDDWYSSYIVDSRWSSVSILIHPMSELQ